jgi:hypothetical protein
MDERGDTGMSGRYAATTDVASTKSRDEIERTLVRYGASEFSYGWSSGRAVIAFVKSGRQVRFELPLPDRDDDEFVLTPSRKYARSNAEAEKAYEQAVKQRWRALALVVKAKLEAIEAGISTFEEEFLSHIVVGEQTIGQYVLPRLQAAIEANQPLSLLPGGSR